MSARAMHGFAEAERHVVDVERGGDAAGEGTAGQRLRRTQGARVRHDDACSTARATALTSLSGTAQTARPQPASARKPARAVPSRSKPTTKREGAPMGQAQPAGVEPPPSSAAPRAGRLTYLASKTVMCPRETQTPVRSLFIAAHRTSTCSACGKTKKTRPEPRR